MYRRIIVSRHKAAVEFLCHALSTEGVEFHETNEGAPWTPPEFVSKVRGWIEGRVRADVDKSFGEAGQTGEVIPVFAEVTHADVAYRIVYGNLPLHLAASARQVVAIEFAEAPPRGAEYTLEDMMKAGARLQAYKVEAV